MKELDRTAPRFRAVRTSLLKRKFHVAFKEKYPQYKDVPDSVLNKIIHDLNEEIWKSVIDTRDGVELPQGVGVLFIGTCNPPSKRHNTNYHLSNDLEQRVRHRNFESDNYLAKIFYTNYSNKYRFKNREIYQFKGCRNFTIETSAAFVENWKMYIQVDNYSRINKLFDKYMYRDIQHKLDKRKLENYDEFNLN